MFPKGDVSQVAPTDDFAQDMAVLNDEAPVEVPEVEEPEVPEVPEAEAEVEESEEPEAEEIEEPEETVKPEVKRPVSLHQRNSVKEITDKYPNFFKEFPSMRHAMFREQEYSALFPTVDDAKEASTAATSFNRFSQLVTSGKPEDFKEFLDGVAQANGLQSMAANFLPSLYKSNRDMYFKVTTPIAASLLRNAYKAAQANGNENLANAALHIAQYALGDTAFATGEKLPESLVPEKTETSVDKERQSFYQERYNVSRDEISKTSDTRLRADIRNGLDPNGVFNDFTGNLLVDKIMSELGQALQADTAHMGRMNSMWKHAFNAGFTGDWKDRIRSAYLSAARAQMPAIRARIRTEALKERQSQALKKGEIADKSANRKDVTGSGNTSGKSGRNTPSAKQIDWSKTSDLDILNDKITLRK